MNTTQRIIIAFVVSLFLITHLQAQIPNLEQLRVPSNMGKEFIFSIPPTDTDATIKFYAISNTNTSVHVGVVGKGIKKSKMVDSNAIAEFTFSNELFAVNLMHDKPSDKNYPQSSCHITSTQPIVLYCIVKIGNKSEGFLCLPVESVGNRYIIASMPDMTWMYGGPSKPSIITISAIEDNTRVNFTLGGNAVTVTSGGLKSGQTKVWTLMKYDVIVITNSPDSKEGDMTGSIVNSDKPVSVVSGNVCANVPTTVRFCNYIAEMERPVSSWGKTYLVPNIPFRKNSGMVKIFASEGNTQIFKNGNPRSVIQKSGGVEGTGYFYERVNANRNMPTVYSANKPINVAFFNQGSEDDNFPTAPFQMNIIPFEKFSKNYLLSTPAIQGNTTFKHHYISLVYRLTSAGTIPNDFQVGRIVADTIQWSGISSTFGQVIGDTFDVKIQGGTYAAKMIELPENGVYYLQSASPFMAYSFAGDSSLIYGMPAGCLMGTNPALTDTTAPVVTVTESTPVVVRGMVTDMPDDVLVRSNLGSITLTPPNGNAVLVTDFVKTNIPQTANWRVERIDTAQPVLVTLTFTDNNKNSSSLRIGMNGKTVIVTPYTPIVKPSIRKSIEREYFCQGETVVLSAPSGYTSYTWSNGATLPTLMLSNIQVGTFIYNVLVSDVNGDTVRSDNVVIEVRAIPPTPTVTYNGSTILSTKEVSGATYQWLFNNTPISGATEKIHIAQLNGVYQVRITLNGCSSTSAEQAIIVNSIENSEILHVVISPNPTSASLQIQYQSTSASVIEIINVVGVIVKTFTVPEPGVIQKELSLADIPSGTYVVKIATHSTILSIQKIIIE